MIEEEAKVMPKGQTRRGITMQTSAVEEGAAGAVPSTAGVANPTAIDATRAGGRGARTARAGDGVAVAAMASVAALVVVVAMCVTNNSISSNTTNNSLGVASSINISISSQTIMMRATADPAIKGPTAGIRRRTAAADPAAGILIAAGERGEEEEEGMATIAIITMVYCGILGRGTVAEGGAGVQGVGGPIAAGGGVGVRGVRAPIAAEGGAGVRGVRAPIPAEGGVDPVGVVHAIVVARDDI